MIKAILKLIAWAFLFAFCWPLFLIVLVFKIIFSK